MMPYALRSFSMSLASSISAQCATMLVSGLASTFLRYSRLRELRELSTTTAGTSRTVSLV